jgi:transposase
MVNWENKTVSVGIDLHKTQFTVCAITSTKEILFEKVYQTNDEGYKAFISECHTLEDKYGAHVSMAIEATSNARYFRNLMQKEGFFTLVINTLKFKVVTLSAKKTDKRDAFTIAEFLLKDMLPESYLCDQETEELRKLICERADLVSLIVRTKNRIHNMMLGYGIVTTATQFQSKKKRLLLLKGLEDHALITKRTVSTLNSFIQTLEILDEQVKALEALIEDFVQEDEDVQLLKTIPGVGKITATTIRAYVGDINRFATYKQFAAYCGLTPFVKFSNEKGFTGHITKNGPVELRTAMVQAVMGMLRLQRSLRYLSLINDYKRMKKNKGSGKSIIAFARKLSRVIYAILKKKKPFDMNKLIGDFSKRQAEAV